MKTNINNEEGNFPKNILFKFHTILSIIMLICTIAPAQNSSLSKAENMNLEQGMFDGLNFGASIGAQNIFGGAFINGLDLLSQKTGSVLEFSVGYRKQFFQRRILIGISTQFGITNGDLNEYDSRFDFDVFYKNNSQNGYGLTTGVALRKKKNLLLFSYAYVTKRSFDIEFADSNGTIHTQHDGQRFLQYGVGLEVPLKNKFNIRGSLGAVDVNYEDLETSQDVEDKMDFNLGIIYQF